MERLKADNILYGPTNGDLSGILTVGLASWYWRSDASRESPERYGDKHLLIQCWCMAARPRQGLLIPILSNECNLNDKNDDKRRTLKAHERGKWAKDVRSEMSARPGLESILRHWIGFTAFTFGRSVGCRDPPLF